MEEADTNEKEDVMRSIIEKQKEIDQNISTNTDMVKRLDNTDITNKQVFKTIPNRRL